MEDNSEFWKYIALAFLMLFCVVLNIHTISIGVNKGSESSIIIGAAALGMCSIMFIFDIIKAIDNYKK